MSDKDKLQQIITNTTENEYICAGRMLREEEIRAIAENTFNIYKEKLTVSDEEFKRILKHVLGIFLHTLDDSLTIMGQDSKHHKGWYLNNKNEKQYWNRYYNKLSKQWGKPIVDKINIVTDEIMDNLGDPLSSAPFQRRGLLLGDVQSGKTSYFTALCTKATDAGYKVIIVLAGVLETLRAQTQKRLNMEFIGKTSTISSKMLGHKNNFTYREKVDAEITPITSEEDDFKASTERANLANVKNYKGAALFVVKKNSRILNNLLKWLTKDTDQIDLPLLMIDDEADNASINTNEKEDDPTAINKAIKNILNVFKQASYVGVTATPFANIFIDPDFDENGVAKDLFPRHFITLLPTPQNYIGATKIFGKPLSIEGEEDINNENSSNTFLEEISDSEMENFFYYGHSKELADELTDIPQSLKDAILYFILVSAISDCRRDNNAHRTMMVNVSRFTDVQNKLADIIDQYLKDLKSDVDSYCCSKKWPQKSCMHQFKQIWDKYNLTSKIKDLSSNLKEFESSFFKEKVKSSLDRIKTVIVNQKSKGQTLDYNSYAQNGRRVIVVGGMSISRGITLEGLITSYFYRNTKMYDTLLQMGRWFGYRPNYEDLFKIWMGEDSIEWFTQISDAVVELKDDLKQMARSEASPETFGLKVRQSEGSLMVTARNKMRESTTMKLNLDIAGKMVETPRLKDDINIIEQNNKLCSDFIKSLEEVEGVELTHAEHVKAFVWKKVPKNLIADLVEDYNSPEWNLGFQSIPLRDYILDDDSKYWTVGMPLGSGQFVSTNIEDLINSCREKRKITRYTKYNLLKVNDHRVRIGSGGCTKIGLTQDQIIKCKNDSKINNSKVTDSTYLRITRDPILLVHRIEQSDIEDMPKYIYGIGLGFPSSGLKKDTVSYEYVVNSIMAREYPVKDYDWEDEDDQ